MSDANHLKNDGAVEARREFLKKCGRFAVVVPPTMTFLLARDANAQGANDCYGATVFNPTDRCPPGLQ